MAFHNFLSRVPLSSFYLFAKVPVPCFSIHSHKLVRLPAFYFSCLFSPVSVKFSKTSFLFFVSQDLPFRILTQVNLPAVSPISYFINLIDFHILLRKAQFEIQSGSLNSLTPSCWKDMNQYSPRNYGLSSRNFIGKNQFYSKKHFNKIFTRKNSYNLKYVSA